MARFLLKNVNVDTVGQYVIAKGGQEQFLIDADSFGGGTVRLEISRDGNTWQPIRLTNGDPAEYTENYNGVMDFLGTGMRLRANFFGSSGASNVNVSVH